MNTTAIKGQITRFIKATMKNENPQLNRWYVGITNNTMRRQAEHSAKLGKIEHWSSWKAKNTVEAGIIEDHFNKKGSSNFKGTRGAIENSWYVYVFKKPTGEYAKGMNGQGLGVPAMTEREFYEYVFVR
jgi:hypothetical protein